MSKARTLADFMADGNPLADGTISVTEVSGISTFGASLVDDILDSDARTTLGLGTAATTDSTDYATAAQGTLADSALQSGGGAMTGAITTNSTIDGRDVAVDGAKLDGIEASADVTDTTNVVAALTAGTNVSIAANGTISSTDTNTTYTAGGDYGMTLSGTEFRLEDDRRRNSTSVDIYSGNTDDYTFYDASHGIRWYTSGSEEMRLENDGDLHVDGNVVAYSTTVSDERLKTDIVKIDSALDKVNQLSGYTFTYIADGKKSAGVIAQEVQRVLPSAITESTLPLKVGEEDETEYMTVQYDQLVGLLVEAVKELKAELSELKGK